MSIKPESKTMKEEIKTRNNRVKTTIGDETTDGDER